MADEKPRIRVPAGGVVMPSVPAVVNGAPRKGAFDAGKSSRRLKGLTTATREINRLIRSYGQTVLARSRYLAANNPYAAQAKEIFVSALAGSGIKPSSLYPDANFKAVLQETWLDWTDEADADGVTDLYGMMATIASEMFEAGECFVRIRPRRQEDGLTVPFQLQLLPSEMLPLNDNRELNGGFTVRMGVEFNPIGQRTGYWFLRRHPGSDVYFGNYGSEQVRVPAEEVLHLYKPVGWAGQIRGIPHTLSAIVTAAVLDAYDDAELERKRIAALFAAFVTRKAPETDSTPLQDAIDAADDASVDSGVALEPGIINELDEGEDITFAEPADVGGNYEAFQYRNLLRMAAGFGVPYAAMTGDLRQTSYGSIRAGLVEFRRRIEALQHSVMIYQFCRPVWRRFMDEAVMAGILPVGLSAYQANPRPYRRARWITPRWEWIDPLKDRQAELLAVQAGFKSRSDVVEAEGYDPEENDARIAQDKAREESLGLDFTESQFAATNINNPSSFSGGNSNGA